MQHKAWILPLLPGHGAGPGAAPGAPAWPGDSGDGTRAGPGSARPVVVNCQPGDGTSACVQLMTALEHVAWEKRDWLYMWEVQPECFYGLEGYILDDDDLDQDLEEALPVEDPDRPVAAQAAVAAAQAVRALAKDCFELSALLRDIIMGPTSSLASASSSSAAAAATSSRPSGRGRGAAAEAETNESESRKGRARLIMLRCLLLAGFVKLKRKSDEALQLLQQRRRRLDPDGGFGSGHHHGDGLGCRSSVVYDYELSDAGAARLIFGWQLARARQALAPGTPLVLALPAAAEAAGAAQQQAEGDKGGGGGSPESPVPALALASGPGQPVQPMPEPWLEEARESQDGPEHQSQSQSQESAREWSTFELLSALRYDRGWVCEKRPASYAQGRRYKNGDRKVFYTTGAAVEERYLGVLLKSEAILRSGVEGIAHGAHADYYGRLLAGEKVPLPAWPPLASTGLAHISTSTNVFSYFATASTVIVTAIHYVNVIMHVIHVPFGQANFLIFIEGKPGTG